MTGFCSLDEAQVLTREGFYQIWKRYLADGLTQVAAYDKAEALHRRLRLGGLPMYPSGFESFIRRHKEIVSRQRQQGARQGVA